MSFTAEAASRPKWSKVVGIVGGLGPRAHIEFEERLLTFAGQRLGEHSVEQDYPSWLLASIPATPDRTKAIISGGTSPVAGILRALDLLKGCDFALIPCMTAHAFIQEIAASSPIPLLDLVDETLRAVAAKLAVTNAGREIGLLASTGTLRSAVFHRAAIARPDIRIVTPPDLDIRMGPYWQESVVMGAIYGRNAGRTDLGGGIKSGSHEVPEIRKRMIVELEGLLNEYAKRGVRVAIPGCTELSILAPALRSDVELIDPLSVGAEAVLSLADGTRSLRALLHRQREIVI
jgi:aspartate racemase